MAATMTIPFGAANKHVPRPSGGVAKRINRRKSASLSSRSPPGRPSAAPGIVFQIPFAFSYSSNHDILGSHTTRPSWTISKPSYPIDEPTIASARNLAQRPRSLTLSEFKALRTSSLLENQEMRAISTLSSLSGFFGSLNHGTTSSVAKPCSISEAEEHTMSDHSLSTVSSESHYIPAASKSPRSSVGARPLTPLSMRGKPQQFPRSPSPRTLEGHPHSHVHRLSSAASIHQLPPHLISPGLQSSADYDADAMDDEKVVLPPLSHLLALQRPQYYPSEHRGVYGRVRDITTTDSLDSSRAVSPLLSIHDVVDHSIHLPAHWAPAISSIERAGGAASPSSVASYKSARARRHSSVSQSQRNGGIKDGDYVPVGNDAYGKPYVRTSSPAFAATNKRTNKSSLSPHLPPSPSPSPMPKAAAPPRKRTASLQPGVMGPEDGTEHLGHRKTCQSCSSTTSAQHTWRTGWTGSCTLCNQCGLRYNRNGHIHCRNCNYIPTKSEANGQLTNCKVCQHRM